MCSPKMSWPVARGNPVMLAKLVGMLSPGVDRADKLKEVADPEVNGPTDNRGQSHKTTSAMLTCDRPGGSSSAPRGKNRAESHAGEEM